MLHLQWDAAAAFDALYCQKGGRLPYGVLIEPYYGGGFHGGKDCPLWNLVVQNGGKPPRWLLVGGKAKPWPGYTYRCPARVTESLPARHLFVRETIYKFQGTCC
jgi:hypothetical protein